MPTLVREELLANRASALATLASATFGTGRNLTSIPDMETFSSFAAMFDGDDSQVDGPEGANLMNLSFDVELWVKADSEEDLGPAFSELLRLVSAKMFEDTNCGGKADWCLYGGVTGLRTDKTEGAPPLMAGIATFTIRYQTALFDLTVQGP
ncbi:MAG: hypothetical protein AB7I36_08275 [Rhodospirillaceae bacterium]